MAEVTTPIGFNFRAFPNSYVDIPPDIRAAIPNNGGGGDQGGLGLYDEAVGYGWTSGDENSYPRAAWHGLGGRLTGSAFIVVEQPRTFRIKVQPGVYRLGCALGGGGAGSAGSRPRLEVLDDGVSRLLLAPVLNGNFEDAICDAAGNVVTPTQWFVNNESGYGENASTVEVVCASGFLDIALTHDNGPTGSYATSLFHLRLAQVSTFNPPTVTDQPDSIEVSQPTSASFSVTLGGGAYTSSFWQTRENETAGIVDLTSETALTYNTGATTLSMSGRQYRFVAVWEGGNVYSNWATLTVNAGPPGVIGTTTTTVTSESTCTFSWENGNPPGSSFVVQLESPYNSNNWVVPAGSFSGNSFLATGLTANIDYRFRVRPVNAAGTNSYTNGAVFRVDNLVTGGDTVESAVIFSQTFQWQILGQVTVSRSFNWSILGSVLASYGFNWSILTEVERSFIYTWVIGDTSTGSGEVDYEAVALAVMSYVLPNGKTVAEQLVSLEKQNNVVIALSA